MASRAGASDTSSVLRTAEDAVARTLTEQSTLEDHDTAIGLLRAELGHVVRIEAGGQIHGPVRVTVCEELGRCPENSARDGRGGLYCCSIGYADDSLHVAEVVPEAEVLPLPHDGRLGLEVGTGIQPPRLFVIEGHHAPPRVLELEEQGDHGFVLPPTSRDHAVVFGILRSPGDRYYKKVFWVLRLEEEDDVEFVEEDEGD